VADRFSDDYAKSAASNMFWFKDIADLTDTNRFIYDATDKNSKLKESDTKLEDLVKKIKGNHNFNEGFLERFKQISLFLPLNGLFGSCKDINRVFRGLPHEIELERNLDDNVIHRSGTGTYKFEITSSYTVSSKSSSHWCPRVMLAIKLHRKLWEKELKLQRNQRKLADKQQHCAKVQEFGYLVRKVLEFIYVERNQEDTKDQCYILFLNEGSSQDKTIK
jgi:hypothetical protein